MSVVGLSGQVSGGSIGKANAYDYDPYGVMLNQSEYVTNPWKYAGGYLDSSKGLYKFGVRYYDPDRGRWTQQDPVGGSLGDLNSANRYVYVGDDPINAVEPSGKISVTFGCIAAVITALYALSQGIPAALSAFQGVYVFAAFISVFNPIIGIVVAIVGELLVAAIAGSAAVGLYDVVASACGLPQI